SLQTTVLDRQRRPEPRVVLVPITATEGCHSHLLGSPSLFQRDSRILRDAIRLPCHVRTGPASYWIGTTGMSTRALEDGRDVGDTSRPHANVGWRAAEGEGGAPGFFSDRFLSGD